MHACIRALAKVERDHENPWKEGFMPPELALWKAKIMLKSCWLGDHGITCKCHTTPVLGDTCGAYFCVRKRWREGGRQGERFITATCSLGCFLGGGG